MDDSVHVKSNDWKVRSEMQLYGLSTKMEILPRQLMRLNIVFLKLVQGVLYIQF